MIVTEPDLSVLKEKILKTSDWGNGRQSITQVDTAAFCFIFSSLTEREQNVAIKRYVQAKTLAEIGEEYGVTREYARKLLKKIDSAFDEPKAHAMLRCGVEQYFEDRLKAEKKALEERERKIAAKKCARDVLKLISEYCEQVDNSSSAEKSMLEAIEIQELGLEKKVSNALSSAGIANAYDIVSCSARDIMAIKNLGPMTVNKIKKAMAEKGVFWQ